MDWGGYVGDAGTTPTADRDAGRPWLRALAIVALVAVAGLDVATDWEAPLLLYVLIAASPAGIHADDIVDRVGKAVAKYIKG